MEASAATRFASTSSRTRSTCVEFARALSVAAARAPDARRDPASSASNAAGAIEVERALHEEFFRDFGLSEDEVRATPPAPTNLAYTSYLLAIAHGGSFAEGLGALLPCYWIYWEVGKTLLERGSPEPLYARWIETYGGEEFGGDRRGRPALAERRGRGARRGRAAAHARALRHRPAATSGCSGTWATAARRGPSDPARLP